MGLLRAHLAAVAIVVAAVLAAIGVFLFARPQYHPYQLPKPPGDGLPYTTPTYSVAEARHAFAAHGINLLGSVGAPGIVGFHTADNAIEVTVFGDKKLVDQNGFSDYYMFVDGHWQVAPKNCVPGAKNAERWRGNVRLTVGCDAATQLPAAAKALASVGR